MMQTKLCNYAVTTTTPNVTERHHDSIIGKQQAELFYMAKL
jgi:hypothetical protein